MKAFPFGFGQSAFLGTSAISDTGTVLHGENTAYTVDSQQSVSQSASQSVRASQSISRSVSESFGQSPSVDQSVSESIGQPAVSRSVGQSASIV